MAMNPESAVVVATLDDIDTDLGTFGSSSKSLAVRRSASVRISTMRL